MVGYNNLLSSLKSNPLLGFSSAGLSNYLLKAETSAQGEEGTSVKITQKQNPARGYLASAKSNQDDRCSTIKLLSCDGGWYRTHTMKQEIPRGTL